MSPIFKNLAGVPGLFLTLRVEDDDIFNPWSSGDLKKKGVFFLYVCVCVDIPFILDVRFVDVPAGATQEEGHAGFLHLPSAVLALIFIARRIQPFLSLVDREVEFCVLTILFPHDVHQNGCQGGTKFTAVGAGQFPVTPGNRTWPICC